MGARLNEIDTMTPSEQGDPLARKNAADDGASIFAMVGKSADEMHKMPRLLVRIEFFEARHAAQANTMLDDPKELDVRPFLNLRRAQVWNARIHGLANMSGRTAVLSMTCRAFHAEDNRTGVCAGIGIGQCSDVHLRGLMPDNYMLGSCSEVGFEVAGLIERAEAGARESETDADDNQDCDSHDP